MGEGALYTSADVMAALAAHEGGEHRAAAAPPPPPPRGAWDDALVAELRRLVGVHGPRWRLIQRELGPGAPTDDALRNKWRRLEEAEGRRPAPAARPPAPAPAAAARCGWWTAEESARLAAAIHAGDLRLFAAHAGARPTTAWRNRAYRLGLGEAWQRCPKLRGA